MSKQSYKEKKKGEITGGRADQSRELSSHENSRPPLIPGLYVPFRFCKHTHRAKEQVGFKRNKLPKYGSERAFSNGFNWKLLKMVIILKVMR